MKIFLDNKWAITHSGSFIKFTPRITGKPIWTLVSDPNEITFFDSKENAELLISLYPIEIPFEIKKISFIIED